MKYVSDNPTRDNKNLDRLLNILRTHIKEFDRCETRKPVEIGIRFRPCSTDLLPIIENLQSISVYIATSHCRYGVTLAPVTAAIISSIILGERNLPVKSQIVDKDVSGEIYLTIEADQKDHSPIHLT